MPEYLSPGIYIDEIEIGAKPIEGVSTSTVGFLGETERGPTLPRLITSWQDYQRVFGKYFGSAKYLPYAVEGFFRNGGQRCYIARIINAQALKAALTLKSDTNKDALIVNAVGEGSWGKRIAAKTKKNPDNATFKMTVYYWKNGITNAYNPDDPANRNKPNPDVTEIFNNVSTDASSPHYYVTSVNYISNLIVVSEPPCGATLPKDSTNNVPALLSGNIGNDPNLSLSDFLRTDISTPGHKKGLSGLAEIDDISILYAPSAASTIGLDNALISQCETLKDRFAVLEVAKGNPAPSKPNQDTKYAAFYCPWIEITDPPTGRSLTIPPGGHVAGIYARSDTERGVHKAPANEVIEGANGVEYQFDKGMQDTLNPQGVNCIRSFIGRGIRVWGARTLSSDSLWKYINVRRLFIYLEKSIEKGTQWVVFEPNNEKLWAQVKQTISQFLTTVWKRGALMGTTPQEAFFVKCDRTTMTQDDIDNGRLIVLIGVAPIKPAEFVIFRIAQWQGGSAATE